VPVTSDLREAVAPLRADPAGSVLLFDFDGTLSPVVDDPAAARPLPGVVERLDALASTYRTVGAVSGRPVAFLAQHLPPSVVLSGLYGLESQVGGRLVHHPDAGRWRPIVAEAVRAAEAAAAPGGPAEGVVVEAKGLSITLHVRTRPDQAQAARDLAERIAAPSGLLVGPAKMSVEVHPPIEANKGTALLALAAGARGVLFVGDDNGDVPAYDALAGLRRSDPSVTTVGVIVDGPELPAALRERDGIVLPDQTAVLDLLDALVV
jgi:trehalose 6-phosphate phosphatase